MLDLLVGHRALRRARAKAKKRRAEEKASVATTRLELEGANPPPDLPAAVRGSSPRHRAAARPGDRQPVPADLNADIINNGVAPATPTTSCGSAADARRHARARRSRRSSASTSRRGIAMGFGRDVRSAIFRRSRRSRQVEVNQFGPPSLITRNTNDVQQVQMVVFMALTIMISAPILIVGGIIMALRRTSRCRAARRRPAADGARHRARHEPRDPAVPGDADEARPDQPGHARDALRRPRHPGVRPDRHEEARFDDANATSSTRRSGQPAVRDHVPRDARSSTSRRRVLWFGAIRVDSGELPIGNLTAFLQYLMQILFAVLMAVFMFVLVPRAAVSAGRIREVLDTEPSIRDPADRPVAAGPRARPSSSATSSSATRAPRQPVLRDISFRAEPGRDDGDRRQHRQRQVDARQPHPAASTTRPAARSSSTASTSARSTATTCGAGSGSSRRRRSCSAARSRATCATATGRDRRRAVARARDRPGPRLRRARCPAASRRRSRRAARTSPAASGSGSRSPGRSSSGAADLPLRRQLLGARLAHRRPAARGAAPDSARRP
jgi:hypothetical protein